MATPFLGEIKMFAGNFAPLGYAFCAGQLMAINQNTALFSLLGTTYGGDGVTTFALPDLQGRVPLHVSNSFVQGQKAGEENVTLNSNQIPQHTHTAVGTATADSVSPAGKIWSTDPGANVAAYKKPGSPVVPPSSLLNGNAIGPAGGNQPHENLQPFQVITYIIALEGIFPSRN